MTGPTTFDNTSTDHERFEAEQLAQDHDVALSGRHGTDPAAAFLHGLDEKHELSDTVFLVDQFGYRTALSRLRLSGQVDYIDRNRIEKQFHTPK